MIPNQLCSRCPLAPVVAATTEALAEVRETAAKLGAEPLPRRVASVTVAATIALTGRELDVLARAAEGWPNAHIARALFISDSTVHTYMARLYRKLDVRDRAHAVHVAWQRGYLGKDEDGCE